MYEELYCFPPYGQSIVVRIPTIYHTKYEYQYLSLLTSTYHYHYLPYQYHYHRQ